MGIGILGTGSYLPEYVLGNEELAGRLGVTEKWILEKTGIRERRIAAPDEATSDLATRAGERALRSAGIEQDDVGVIVLASGTFDQPTPATACFVQANLGVPSAITFDVGAVCAGFLYAMRIARDLLAADPSLGYALVIGSEVYSRFLDYQDKRTSVLPGDGAGAVVLGRTATHGILTVQLGADGTHAGISQIRAGGSRMPASSATVSAGHHYAAMDGRKVREVVAELLPGVVGKALSAIGIAASDLDLVVPHQANRVMLEEWASILGIGMNIVHETVTKYGNTGAASVPITLDDAIREGRISVGDKVLSVAFGAGVSWGATIMEWAREDSNDSAGA